METTTALAMRARPETVLRLAAATEDWPRILPHYRWVRVLRQDGEKRVVEMAARRDFIPVRWTAIQEVFPERRSITFRHIRGVTRGMDVAWAIAAGSRAGTVEVRIWHRFCPGWPLVPDWLIGRVVGEFFVDAIATRTLRRIREIAEAEDAALVVGT